MPDSETAATAPRTNGGSVHASVESLNSRILVAFSRNDRMSSQAIGRVRATETV